MLNIIKIENSDVLIVAVIILISTVMLKLLAFYRDFIILYISNSILGLICLYVLIYLRILNNITKFYLILISFFGVFGTIAVAVLELIFKY